MQHHLVLMNFLLRQFKDTKKYSELTLVERELYERLGWFVRIRWLAAGGALLVLLAANFIFAIQLHHSALLVVIGGIFLYNLIFSIFDQALEQRDAISPTVIRIFANAQILADLICLFLLMRFSGGLNNFFVVFFVFHMVISSELLGPFNSYALASFAVLLVCGDAALQYYGWLPLVEVDPRLSLSLYARGLLLLEVCAVFSATLFISVYLSSTISQRLRQREGELELANQKLQTLDEQKSYFMRKASHELRSPLAAMQSMIKAALTGTEHSLPQRQYDLLVRSEQRAMEMLGLVNDLLRIAQLRYLETVQERLPVDLAALCARTLELFAPLAEEKQLTLSGKLGPATVVGEDQNLEQVVNNLISNAIRYTPAGGRIMCTTRTYPPYVVLRVSDTGIGIPETDGPHIFEEFYRAGNARKAVPTGTGLGLAIVKKVVEMHGGQVRLESQVGQGTSFTCFFPRELPEP